MDYIDRLPSHRDRLCVWIRVGDAQIQSLVREPQAAKSAKPALSGIEPRGSDASVIDAVYLGRVNC